MILGIFIDTYMVFNSFSIVPLLVELGITGSLKLYSHLTKPCRLIQLKTELVIPWYSQAHLILSYPCHPQRECVIILKYHAINGTEEVIYA